MKQTKKLLSAMAVAAGLLTGCCGSGNTKCSGEVPVLVNAIPMPPWLHKLEQRHAGKRIRSNEAKMEFVINLAEENVRQGTGGPFAAVIFDKEDRLVALGVNVVENSRQSWAHAEMVAFAHAQNLLNSRELKECSLVTSCEPCAMCSGAIPWSGVGKMIFGAPKSMPEKIGFYEGYKGDLWEKEFNRRGIKVEGPLLKDRAFAPFALYQKMNKTIY